MEGTHFRYVIKFVADMGKAVNSQHDVLGLQLKFGSPGWSEFVTGETILALHPASEKKPTGKVELGFTVADVEAFYPVNLTDQRLGAESAPAVRRLLRGSHELPRTSRCHSSARRCSFADAR